uniref:Uncharacterized protein n=1 Tax=Tanacetum cinerariifolium TaxID=118510 RepID=A0A6L2LJB6_TANCI|nr:hypothetical protein [Tanacetum cinerariifolium]
MSLALMKLVMAIRFMIVTMVLPKLVRMIDVNMNDATETGDDDKTDGCKKDDSLARDGDSRVHDGKNDATDMDNVHGVIDDTENEGSKKITEN